MNARQKRQEKGIGLLDMCLELHMSNTNSSDYLSKDIEDFYIENLKETLNGWGNPLKQTLLFDNAVKELVMATLLETVLNK